MIFSKPLPTCPLMTFSTLAFITAIGPVKVQRSRRSGVIVDDGHFRNHRRVDVGRDIVSPALRENLIGSLHRSQLEPTLSIMLKRTGEETMLKGNSIITSPASSPADSVTTATSDIR